jgi:Tfp pilus assembly protein FimT
MKLFRKKCGALPRRRCVAGMSLIECLVYITVFALLLAGGTAVFYFSWDHTRAVIFTSNEISAALRAGETWRADVRGATEKISVQEDAGGETVKIPAGGKEIIYRFSGGELRREVPAQGGSRVLLERVKISEMKSAARDGVDAWRWELELAPRRKETQLPLSFTFAAAPMKP